MIGFLTLFNKELLRFWKVGLQTVFAPVLSSLLYLMIFSSALEKHVQAYPDVPYPVFLIPGLMIMAMLQNAFANSASSLIQSTVSGNHIFMLLSPLSHQEIFAAYVLASVVRGVAVGMGIYLATFIFFELPVFSLLWISLFALMGTALLGAFGILAGIWAGNNFEQLAAVQNFIILPLTFLSGVFYTLHSLPPFWQGLSRLNPFFYMVDGFRYGFLGVSEASPYSSLGILAGFVILISFGTLLMLKSGYKIRQ